MRKGGSMPPATSCGGPTDCFDKPAGIEFQAGDYTITIRTTACNASSIEFTRLERFRIFFP